MNLTCYMLVCGCLLKSFLCHNCAKINIQNGGITYLLTFEGLRLYLCRLEQNFKSF